MTDKIWFRHVLRTDHTFLGDNTKLGFKSAAAADYTPNGPVVSEADVAAGKLTGPNDTPDPAIVAPTE